MIGALQAFVFARRRLILAIFALVTLVLGTAAARLPLEAGFEKQLPLGHPYMETFLRYQDEFGGANRLLIAVRARDGDIFDPHFFETLEKVTDAVFFLPGVNRSSVRSIFTPNVRFVDIVEGGFAGGNVVPAEFRPVPSDIADVRENILKAGLVGRLVAEDFSAAMVSADLVDRDPATGEPIDYSNIARALEQSIRLPFTDDEIDIHIVGFAKAVGDIAAGAAGVILFFGIAFLVTAFVVYVFVRSGWVTVLPLACALIAVIWTLGLLALLGYALDPMSILVPFLIFAIGTSHGVQMVNAVAEEALAGTDSVTNARRAFRRLLVPGGVALVSDAIGFLTILLIGIKIIQELAITASLGVLVIMLTNLVLLPLLLSFRPFGRDRSKQMLSSMRLRERLWRWVAALACPLPAAACLAGALVILVIGLLEAREVRIGDLRAGVPELRPDSRYNQDSRFIAEHFGIGVDLLQVIVETKPDGCVDHAVMAAIDRFQWHMQNVPGVQSTLSMPEIAKTINAGWNEGSLKWRVLPRNQASMVQAITPIETSTGLLNHDCSVMPVLIFTEDHKADTIERVVTAVEAYANEHNDQNLTFRLATGNLGVMAAANQVVEAAQLPMLLWIYLAIVGLCGLTFRSFRGTLCIVLPLGLVSVLVYALMSLLGIGLKVSTLPVAALGVGIGVDYGIYLFARLHGFLEQGRPLAAAYLATLRTTGKAVLLTGLTLALGVSTWLFSALQFQADMGLLLAFMFIGNMLGALLLLPALAFVLYELPARWRGSR
jgi:predicted RND superfamily exporter protein